MKAYIITKNSYTGHDGCYDVQIIGVYLNHRKAEKEMRRLIEERHSELVDYDIDEYVICD